jgi:alanyl-tRNA synthetase
VFPELVTNAVKVKEIIRREEELFTRTLASGLNKFDRLTKNMKPGDTLGGAETFLLYGIVLIYY